MIQLLLKSTALYLVWVILLSKFVFRKLEHLGSSCITYVRECCLCFLSSFAPLRLPPAALRQLRLKRSRVAAFLRFLDLTS